MLFRILGKISLDSTEFTAGLKNSESALGGFANKMAAAFSTAAVLAFIKASADLAGEISDLSDELNITTDQVQELKMAALESGIAFDKFAAALTRVRKAKNEALHGDKDASAKFKRMGIDPNQNDYDLFKQVGKSGSPEAVEMLGKGGMAMLDALSKIHELGPAQLITEENAKLLDSAGDNLKIIWETLKAITANTIATPLARIGATAGLFMEGFNKGFGMDKTENKGFWRTLGSASNGMMEGLFGLMDINAGAARDRNKWVNNPALPMPDLMTSAEMDDDIWNMEENVASLDRLGKRKKKGPTVKNFKVDQEKLTSIGGGLGGTAAVVNIQREQLTTMREMKLRIDAIATKIESVETE